MPGYTIHLAIGEQYAKKNKIENKQEFINGIIVPDLIDKKHSHFADENGNPQLEAFIKCISLDTDYNKGYFLHLITDYLFYNRFLQQFSEEIYHDYNKLNRFLIEKYNIHIPQEIQSIVEFEEGEPKLLDRNSICKFIETISQIDFEKIKALKSYIENYPIYRKETDLEK